MQMLTSMTFSENSQNQLVHKKKKKRFRSKIILLSKCPITITKFSDSVLYATLFIRLPWSHKICKGA